MFSSPKKRNIALEGDFEELLSQYYQRLFPFKKFYNWLSYCEGRILFIFFFKKKYVFIYFLKKKKKKLKKKKKKKKFNNNS